MSQPAIVQNPSMVPGRCIMSGDTTGPFLDTGVSLPRYGRVYLSLFHAKSILASGGFTHEDDLRLELSELEELRLKVKELEEYKSSYEQIIEAVSQYVPTPEPEVVERTTVEARTPTNEEVEEWIRNHGANHPAVKKATSIVRGSAEEWYKLYGSRKSKAKRDKPRSLPPKPENKTVKENKKQEVTELYGQEVVLDDLLNSSISTITSFCEDKPEEFIHSLIVREFSLAEEQDRAVRKGLLHKFGYWDDEADEPLNPEEVEFEDDSDDTEEE